MKSTTNKKQVFSMEDFEKGLMLAGYLMPNSVVELEEREKLEQFESTTTAQKSENVYFKRVVLAAEIASKLNQEPSFGRIKFQKLVYLCEHIADMKLEERYQKQAAGPFDNKFMHTIGKELQKNQWFEVRQILNGNYKRSIYVPLDNCDGYKTYYDRYYKLQNDKIQYIIELFRHLSTDNTELATTILACYLELKSKNITYSWEALIDLFYSWSDKKKRFPEANVRQYFNWLQKQGLITL